MNSTITTDKGITYPIDFAGILDGTFRARFYDDRPIMEIAPEFTGVQSIHKINEEGREFDYNGYDELRLIEIMSPGLIRIELGKKGSAE